MYVSDPGVSWATAEADAASLSYMGATGYLAVVTSAAENNFLAANFTISTTSFGLVSSFLRARHLSAGPMLIGVGSNQITPRALHT